MLRRSLLALPMAFAISELCAAQRQPLAVATTFNAISELVRLVAGGAAAVTELIPDKTEPHDFTPTLKTLKALQSASLLVTAGNGMEPWAAAAARTAGVVRIVEAAAGFDAGHEPHVWLAPAGVRFMARRVAEALSSAEPQKADVFHANLAALEAKLADFEVRYGERFAQAPRKTFVTGHAAFGALCTQFGLAQKSVEDVFAHGEPTVKKLAQLARWCQENSVRTVFSEALASPAVSETLAREAGARVMPIFTMESSEDGTPFLTRLEQNLERIATALEE